jgi:hypothetical protein
MNFPKTVLLLAIFSTVLPVVAVFLRGRSRRLVMVSTLLAAVAMSVMLAAILGVVDSGPRTTPTPWIVVLFASAVFVLLAGYLFSLCLGREHPEESVRQSRGTMILLGVAGAVLVSFVHQHHFVSRFDPMDGRGTIHLGALGKIFLSYLLIGVVLVGYNLEKTYRIASTEARPRIRLPIAGLFSLLAYQTFLLAGAMLYASIGMGKMIALALPVGFAGVMVAYGYLRGAITDVNAPVSRTMVYSSFTAVAAGLFVLAIGAAAQIANRTSLSPDEILVVAFVFLVVLIVALLLFSNRFQRRVRRFIDRNFYVNRYDYRTQWSALTEVLDTATDRATILSRAPAFLQSVFAADAVTIALRDDATQQIRPCRGKGSDTQEILERESPLYRRLCLERKSLLLNRKTHDFTYLPIYAEDHAWLDSTASRIVAPLFDGKELVGTIGLERRDEDDPFTYEDVALLDSISAHVAAALRTMELAREVVETREMELMSHWSSMLLHDLKNYLAPLRMAATNLVEYKDRPEIGVVCAGDINRVTDRMEKLVHTLAELRRDSALGREALCPNQLVREAIAGLQVAARPSIAVDLQLRAEQSVQGDPGLLRRVLENLITNAVEAMSGVGTLSICTEDYKANGASKVQFRVTDTGCGIPDEFLRDRLFRPFATTKRKGLGLGLYQCRSIIRAHGGDLRVESRVGAGSVFEITLAALSRAIPSSADKVAV